MHLIKEIVHVKQGDKIVQIPELRELYDWQRPYWVTKKGFRNHEDKKEWEDLEKLDRFRARQCDLPVAVARSLGEPRLAGDMRRINASPYVYGTDILSTALVKQQYQAKWPTLNTPYRAAPFDVETDVVHGTNEIIIATLAFGKKVTTAVTKKFVEGEINVVQRLHEKLKKYLSAMEREKVDAHGDPTGEVNVVDILAKRGIEWEVVVVDREIDVVKHIFTRAHEWKPDFISVWNLDFDIPRVLAACDRAGVDPKDIFSDPSIPKEYRFFRYKRGNTVKVMASGKRSPIKPPQQWHTVYCPASFYVIDAMCSYRHIRQGAGDEPSYSLGAIMNKHFGGRKLQFKEAEGFSGIEYHQFMQSQHPLEYIIYNVWDSVGMEELDEETNDLSLSLAMYSGASDFENFKSQPRRLVDKLHFFCLENNRVISSTSHEMADDFDDETVDAEGWIVTLPAHLVLDNGLNLILENPWMKTNIRVHVADLDVSASYPNGGVVFNISKETTSKELISVAGIDDSIVRMQGINLSGGPTNAVEFCTQMYGLPTLEQALGHFQSYLAESEVRH